MRNRAEIVTLIVAVLATIASGKRFYITSKGECTKCACYGSNDYGSCFLGPFKNQWDYCSITPGHTTREEQCRDDHQCGFHGKHYLWCYIKGSIWRWDYCSQIEDTTQREYTTIGDECQNYCDLVSGTYKCRKEDNQYEKCSLIDGVTANGTECSSLTEYKAKLCSNNKIYNTILKIKRCLAHEGSWDLCSIPKVDGEFPDNCREKRAVDKTCSASYIHLDEVLKKYVQQLANGAQRVTIMFVEHPDRSRIRLADGTQTRDAQTLLHEFHRGNRLNHGGTTQHSHGIIRLDLQGNDIHTPNHGIFENWQLQINGANLQRPTTVAQVMIPERLVGYEERGWMRMLLNGLHNSLARGAPVWIFQVIFPRGEEPTYPGRHDYLRKTTSLTRE